jgi:excisionase family DNA binding protein
MERPWYSVEQVAGRLGLHVRTVRGYIRDGKLAAVRIGKQYRVAASDLDAFTGRPAAETRARAEVYAVVELDGIGAAAADRLSTLLLAGAQLQRDSGEPLRITAGYDDVRARLKIIVVGGPRATADVLGTVHDLLEPDSGLVPTHG